MADKEKLRQIFKKEAIEASHDTSAIERKWFLVRGEIIEDILDWHKEEVAEAERKAALKGYFKAMNDYNKLREEQSQEDTHA